MMRKCSLAVSDCVRQPGALVLFEPCTDHRTGEVFQWIEHFITEIQLLVTVLWLLALNSPSYRLFCMAGAGILPTPFLQCQLASPRFPEEEGAGPMLPSSILFAIFLDCSKKQCFLPQTLCSQCLSLLLALTLWGINSRQPGLPPQKFNSQCLPLIAWASTFWHL